MPSYLRGRNGGAFAHRRMASARPAGRPPGGAKTVGAGWARLRLTAPAQPSSCCRAPGRADRPPVKSTDRPGVAPRKSRDGKRKSAVSAPGLRPVRSGALRGAPSDDFSSSWPPSMRAQACSQGVRARPLERSHEALRHHETAPPRRTRGRCHADAIQRPFRSRLPAATVAGRADFDRVRRTIASRRAARGPPLQAPPKPGRTRAGKMP